MDMDRRDARIATTSTGGAIHRSPDRDRSNRRRGRVAAMALAIAVPVAVLANAPTAQAKSVADDVPTSKPESSPTVPTPPPSSGGDTSVERTAALVQPATVRLQMSWATWVDTGSDGFGRFSLTLGGSCTGFIVSPDGHVATAGHCVDTSLEGMGKSAIREVLQELVDRKKVTSSQASSDAFVEHALKTWTIEGKSSTKPPAISVTVYRSVAGSGDRVAKSTAKIIDSNPLSKGDVALLKIEGKNLPSLALADTTDITLGTEVLSVGYPALSDKVTEPTMSATFKDGKISSKKTLPGGRVPVYEVSSAMSVGMSGGPTVNADGKVIGVNSFGPGGETQSFNFLAPAMLIDQMLERHNIDVATGSADQLYREAVDLHFAGSHRAAVEKFDQLLRQVPDHKKAQELRKISFDKAKNEPTGNGNGTDPDTVIVEHEYGAEESSAGLLMALAGGLTLLLVCGSILLAVLISRRRKAGAAADSTATPSFVAPFGTPTAPAPMAATYRPAAPPAPAYAPPTYAPPAPGTTWTPDPDATARYDVPCNV